MSANTIPAMRPMTPKRNSFDVVYVDDIYLLDSFGRYNNCCPIAIHI